jgi:hypothetical protein
MTASSSFAGQPAPPSPSPTGRRDSWSTPLCMMRPTDYNLPEGAGWRLPTKLQPTLDLNRIPGADNARRRVTLSTRIGLTVLA